MSEWSDVGKALLGSWPSQVASWGREVIAAYLAEVEARGVSPDGALVAIRSCPAGRQFPPSAPELAGLARHDPNRPTFDECYQQLYGPGGVFGVKRSGVQISPWVLAFVERSGRERLRLLEVEHPDYGGAIRRELRQSFEAFLEATEGRAVAALASGRRRGELGRVDPLAAVGGRRPEIGAGASTTEENKP